MQSIDTRELQSLERSFDDLLEKAPDMRRVLHEQLADLVKGEVDTAMSQSGMQQRTGKVQRWQQKHVGSGGGYAAVRPQRGTLPPNKKGKAYAFGHITQSLEGGHKIPDVTSTRRKYRPRIHVAHVNGFHFYGSARSSVEAKAIAAADAFADKLAQMLEGGG